MLEELIVLLFIKKSNSFTSKFNIKKDEVSVTVFKELKR